mgnify:FL=1
METDLKHALRSRLHFIHTMAIVLFSTTLCQAQVNPLPDLVVLDIWESGGRVYYTLKNSGTGTAPGGHATTLAVDGKVVDGVMVSTTLKPGGTTTGSFGQYQWKCAADGSHAVVVRADVHNKIAELIEKNNSRQETWVCDVSPPKITAGPQAMYITQTSAKISWTTDEDSDSVVKYGTTSKIYKFTESSQSPTKDHKIFLDGLLPDTRYYYVVESTDQAGNTVRSDEHTFRTLPDQTDLPDLYVEDIWPDGSTVYCRIGNAGKAPAAAGHVARLSIDGQLAVSQNVAVAIPAGGSHDLAFQYAWTCSQPQDTVRVDTDATGAIEEEDEQNNSRDEVWVCQVEPLEILSGPTATDITHNEARIVWTTNQPSDSTVQYGTAPGTYSHARSDGTPTTNHEMMLEGLASGLLYYFRVESQNASGTASSGEQTFQTEVYQLLLADLVVDGIWRQDYQIVCKIKNVGDATAAANHLAGLYADGHMVDSARVPVPLAPGEAADVVFRKFYFECREPAHTFRVTADVDDDVVEKDEANNSLDRTFVCEETPLRIVAGPFVRRITATTADILWDTNRAADSTVLYDTHAGLFGLEEADGGPTTKHEIHLQHLTPGGVYQFKVLSADSGGQSAESKPGYFRTTGKAGGGVSRIREVTFVRQPTDFPCYKMEADTDEEAEPDKVQFFLDRTLIHTDYSAPFEAVLTPGLLDMSRAEFFRPHATEAVASVAGTITDRFPGLFEPVYECNQITAEFEWPFRDEIFYVPGETAPAGMTIPVRVTAYEWDTTLIMPEGIETLPGAPESFLDFDEYPVEEMRFYLNGAHVETVPSQSDHIYEIECPVDAAPKGMHVLRADAVADDECIQTLTRDFYIEQGEAEIEATRQVWREGNAFRIRLNIRNAGTVSYLCSVIRDNVDGLQPIHDTYDDYRITATPSSDGRHCDVSIYPSSPGVTWYEIRPGRTFSVEYYAIPIQFPGPGSPAYEIGDDPVEILEPYHVDTWRISCPCVRTEDDDLLDNAIDSAIEGSDYQLVTNPELCASEFALAADLLSEIARLAYYRNGVLGYPSGPGSDDPLWIRDCIRMWGATMTGSDGAAGNYLSNGYLLLVGETEILPAWTVDVADMHWSGGKRSAEVGYSDLPYGDTISSDNVPELSVGRIIGDTAAALTQAMQSSIYAGFDRSYGVATSGSEGDWEDFVGNARDIVTTWTGQAAGGEIMTEETKAHHWSAYIHKEQINNGHDFPVEAGDGFLTGVLAGYGMAAVRVDPDADRAEVAASGDLGLITTSFSGHFTLPFDSGDALTAGDLDADGEDEVIVGAIARGKLIVACDPPNTTPSTYLEFDGDLEPWDAIACGRLFPALAQEQLVVARPADGGTVDIYEYVSSPAGLYRTYRLDIPFSAYDGLAVAEVDGGNPGAEILIGSDGDQRIYVYDRRANPLMEIPCEPYTAFDSLVAGDLDGDGADELAVVIDDAVDSKRRVHIFNDNCVAWDATDGWQLVRGRSHLVYSRFLRCEGARTTGTSTRYDGVTCDDLDGDGKAEICLAREQSDRLYVLDGHYTQGWKDRYFPVLQRDEDLIDVFVLSGHGSPGSCSPFGRDDIRTLNLTAGPLVFALSCLTGNYEGEWWWYKDDVVDSHSDGDDGFAETFFAQGAAAYIGATEVSGSTPNSAAGPAFLAQWDPSEPAGKAFRDYRRGRARSGDDLWRFWATEYNYYGDPKFGALGDGLAAAAEAESEVSIAAEPAVPSSPVIQLPDYEVTSVDGEDRVAIRGGDVLIEADRPQVPIYRLEWAVPPEVVVQDVRLFERDGLKTDEGLRLPITRMTTDADRAPLSVASDPQPGWFPQKELDWQIIPGADGTSTLTVTLYPFQYNAQTTEVRYHQQHALEIETLESRARITILLTDRQVYMPGEFVTVKVGLSAGGEVADAFVETTIRQYGSDDLVAGLLLEDLSGLIGTASYAALWDSGDAAPGLYYAETKIIDLAGQLLAHEESLFRIAAQE